MKKLSLLAVLFLVTPAWGNDLWETANQGPSIDLPSLSPLVARSKPSLVVVRTPKAPLPPGHPPIPEALQRGEASGFIIHRKGYVLTNFHTIGCERTIQVKVFGHENWHEARVVGGDKETDVALLMLPERKNGWPYIPLGESNQLKPGDFVVALGHPQGLRFSVSLGILSGVGRDTGSEAEYGYLQTDAAINPGNSGGPLLGLGGLVVGINSAIDPRAKGIAYSIPIDVVKRILPQLHSTGRLPRGWLGVTIAEGPEGPRVQTVEKGSPAFIAGLQPGDIISEVDGVGRGLSVRAFRREVRLLGPGASLKMIISRGENAQAIEVSLKELPTGHPAALSDPCTGALDAPATQPVP